MNTHEKTSKELKKLYDLYPVDISPAATKADREMKDGLAYAFANAGFRKFMENCIRHVNQSLIGASSQEHMIYYKAQMKTLMEIMAAGKAVFVDSELMRNRTQREKAFQVEKADKESVKQHGTV